MGRLKVWFSAIALTLTIALGSAVSAQAAPQPQGKIMKVLTLPQRADILNKMAIHNALKGDPRKAAHFFLRSFHISRKARDKKRAIRAISNLKRLEKKFGRTAILGKKTPQAQTEKSLKAYNMPEWRKSHEA